MAHGSCQHAPHSEARKTLLRRLPPARFERGILKILPSRPQTRLATYIVHQGVRPNDKYPDRRSNMQHDESSMQYVQHVEHAGRQHTQPYATNQRTSWKGTGKEQTAHVISMD